MTFNQLISLKLSYFEENNAVQISQNSEEDVERIAALVGEGSVAIISSLVSGIGTMAALFILSWELSLYVVLFFLISFAINLLISKIAYRLSTELITETQSFSEWFGDVIMGIKEIKYWGIESQKFSQMSDKLKKISSLNIKNGIVTVLGDGLSSVLLNILMVAIYIQAVLCLIHSNIDIGTLLTFISFVAYLESPIMCLVGLIVSLSAILPSVERFYKFLSENKEIHGVEIHTDSASIDFQNVSFSYNKHKILDDCTFSISEGDKVGIVGVNGSGKTTLINLIVQSIHPQEGFILIGGKSISDYAKNAFRKNIAYVGQETFLFNDTIKNNICLGKEIEFSKLDGVIDVLNLKELVNEKGYNYIVGENGSKLSGGQCQKISFARALVNVKPIVILDEFSSNMDNFSIEKMKTIFDIYLRDCTVICVTHDKKLMPLFDYCIELVNGKTYRRNYKNLL